jgi:hypothetical protein
MRRLTAGVGMCFAVAALALLALAPGGPVSSRSQAAAGPFQATAGAPRVVGRCPAEGSLREARPAERPRAQLAAIRFASAWWGGSGAAAVEYADVGFRAEASSLAQGYLREGWSVQARVVPLGHGDDAREIAHLCGSAVVAATVAVDVRRSGKLTVTRVYLVHRPKGYLVWAIR